MTTTATLKSVLLLGVIFLFSQLAQAQRPTLTRSTFGASDAKKALISQNTGEEDVQEIVLLDTVFLLEKTATSLHFRISPRDGMTYWRYKMMSETVGDETTSQNAWTEGMAQDTCCVMFSNLETESEYLFQFRRGNEEADESVVWYSMSETTLCAGPALDQLKMIGLNHESASFMCDMEATAFEWKLKRVGGSTSKHIETTSNTVDWTNLPANTAHECRVRYNCDGKWSDYSQAEVFTTYQFVPDTCGTMGSDDVYTSDITAMDVQLNCKMSGLQYSWGMRESGTTDWTIYNTSKGNYQWKNLKPGKTYQYKVKVECKKETWSSWSSTHYFTTKKEDHNVSCYPPSSHHMSVKNVTYNSASVYCSMEGLEYHWSIKPHGGSNWTAHSTTTSYKHWSNLKHNTKYEYKVKVKCHGGHWTEWSSGYWFTTKDHYSNDCYTPKSHHMSVKDLTYHSAITYCGVEGKEFHWALKESGGTHWIDYSVSHNYYSWTNLKYNTKYEYKVKVKCHNGYWTDWSDGYWFTTPNHYGYDCVAPKYQHLSVKDLTYNSASTHCSAHGKEYHWAMRKYGASDWVHQSTSYNHYGWTGLHYNTKYEFKVKILCHDGKWTNWSDLYWFTTPDHHYNHCTTPQSHHMSVKNLTYNSASTYCDVMGYQYHWKLRKWGSTEWHEYTTDHNYYHWTGLWYNTKYEYMVKVKCHDGSWTGWSQLWWFQTPDHYGNQCKTPTSHHISVKEITYNSAKTHCSMDGYEYHWALKPWGSSQWFDQTTSYGHHHWTNLHYGTKYEYKVKVKCHNGYWTDWSDIFYFNTHDHYNHCSTPESHHLQVKNLSYNGASTYCLVSGAEYHWALKQKGSSSWKDHSGPHHYHDWTDLHYNTEYEYKVKVKCHDGSWTNWSNVYYFTTHDHHGYGCSAPYGSDFTAYQQTYNLFRIYLLVPFSKWTSAIRVAGTYDWFEHSTTVNNIGWGNLLPNTKYEYRVKRECADGSKSDWSLIKSFWTGTAGSSGRIVEGSPTVLETVETEIQVVSSQAIQQLEMEIFPNPANRHFTVSGVQEEANLTIYDLQGRVRKFMEGISSNQEIDLQGLESGLYQVMIINLDGSKKHLRLIVQAD